MTSPRRPRPSGTDGPLRPIAWDRSDPPPRLADQAALEEITRSTRSTVAGILWMLMQRVRPAPPGRKLGWAASTAKALGAEIGVSAPTIGKRAKVVAAALDGADLPWPSHLHSVERQRMLMFRRQIDDFRRDNRLA